MQYDHFIGQVQHRARLASRGEAESATRATLETLGERIPEGLVDNVAGQLPTEAAVHLRRTITMNGSGTGERFDRDEFVARVASRGEIPEPRAAYQARVVLEVFREATQGGVVNKIREALPEDVRTLVDAGSSGSLD